VQTVLLGGQLRSKGLTLLEFPSEESISHFNIDKAFIQYASVFGAGVVGTETGIAVNSDESVYRKNYLRFVRNLERLLEKAEQFGVCIGIEPTRCGAVCSAQVM